MVKLLTRAIAACILISSVNPILEADNKASVQITCGIGDTCKRGYWFPVSISAEGLPPQSEGILKAYLSSYTPVGEDDPKQQFALPWRTDNHGRCEVSLGAWSREGDDRIHVELMADGHLLASGSAALRLPKLHNHLIAGVLTSRPDRFADLQSIAEKAPVYFRFDSIIHALDAGAFRGKSADLDALDMLIIDDVKPAEVIPLVDAVQHWLVRGGRVLLLPAALESWAEPLAGVSVDQGATSYRVSRRFLEFFGIDGDSAALGRFIDVRHVAADPFEVDLPDSGLCLLMTREAIEGQIQLLAFDPNDLYDSRQAFERIWATIFSGQPVSVRFQLQPLSTLRPFPYPVVVPAATEVEDPIVPLVIFVIAAVLILGPLTTLIVRCLRRLDLIAVVLPAASIALAVAAIGLRYIGGDIQPSLLVRTMTLADSGFPVKRHEAHIGMRLMDDDPHVLEVRANGRSSLRILEHVTEAAGREALSQWSPQSPPEETLVQARSEEPELRGPRGGLRFFHAEMTQGEGSALEGIALVFAEGIKGWIFNGSDQPINHGFLLYRGRTVRIGTIRSGDRVSWSLDLTQAQPQSLDLIPKGEHLPDWAAGLLLKIPMAFLFDPLFIGVYEQPDVKAELLGISAERNEGQLVVLRLSVRAQGDTPELPPGVTTFRYTGWKLPFAKLLPLQGYSEVVTVRLPLDQTRPFVPQEMRLYLDSMDQRFSTPSPSDALYRVELEDQTGAWVDVGKGVGATAVIEVAQPARFVSFPGNAVLLRINKGINNESLYQTLVFRRIDVAAKGRYGP